MKIGDVITINPKLVSGTPCFKGSRMPVGHLSAYLRSGQSLEDFLTDYEIEREKVMNFFEFLEETFAEPNTTKYVPGETVLPHESVP